MKLGGGHRTGGKRVRGGEAPSGRKLLRAGSGGHVSHGE